MEIGKKMIITLVNNKNKIINVTTEKPIRKDLQLSCAIIQRISS